MCRTRCATSLPRRKSGTTRSTPRDVSADTSNQRRGPETSRHSPSPIIAVAIVRDGYMPALLKNTLGTILYRQEKNNFVLKRSRRFWLDPGFRTVSRCIVRTRTVVGPKRRFKLGIHCKELGPGHDRMQQTIPRLQDGIPTRSPPVLSINIDGVFVCLASTSRVTYRTQQAERHLYVWRGPFHMIPCCGTRRLLNVVVIYQIWPQVERNLGQQTTRIQRVSQARSGDTTTYPPHRFCGARGHNARAYCSRSMLSFSIPIRSHPVQERPRSSSPIIK